MRAKEHFTALQFDEGVVMSSDATIVAPQAKTIICREGLNQTVSFSHGAGSTFPLLGESISKLIKKTDYMSFRNFLDESTSALRENEVLSSDKEVNSLLQANLRQEIFTAKRQSLFLDNHSFNSQTFSLFSEIKVLKTAPQFDKKLKFNGLDKGLSSFPLYQLSLETSTVVFNSAGKLSLCYDQSRLDSAFAGLLEFSLRDKSKNVIRPLCRVRDIVPLNKGRLVFLPVDEAACSEAVMNQKESKSVVEVMTSRNDVAIEVDDSLIKEGDFFLVNKTSQPVRITLTNGDTHNLNPYAIEKIRINQVSSVTVFKSLFAYPTRITEGAEEKFLFKPLPTVKYYSVGDRYVNAPSFSIDKITRNLQSSLNLRNESGLVHILSYATNLKLEKTTVVAFGDELGMRYNETDIIIRNGEVLTKKASETDFATVKLPDTKTGGERKYVQDGIEFSSKESIVGGRTIEDKAFMYETNYTYTKGAVHRKLTGQAYPVGFYRITFQQSGCLLQKFPMQDGNVNVRNSYYASEIALVLSAKDGELAVLNRRDPDEDRIIYSYLSAFAKHSKTAFVIESFGMVSRKTLPYTVSEHWLAKKILADYPSDYPFLLQGTASRTLENYYLCWVALRQVGSKEIKFFFELESEHGFYSHLGNSFYLSQPAIKCEDEQKYALNKLSTCGHPYKYDLFTSTTINSMEIQEIIPESYFTSEVISAGHMFHVDPLPIKTEMVGNYGLHAISVQESSSLETNIYHSSPTNTNLNEYFNENIFLYTLPEIGLICSVPFALDTVPTQVEKIKDNYKRGVRYTFATHTVEAWFSEAKGIAESNYLVSIDGKEVYLEQKPYPEFMNKDQDIYNLKAFYLTEMRLDELHCQPTILASLLYAKYGFIQCILGVWSEEDEDVLLDDTSLQITKEHSQKGHLLVASCNGLSPKYIINYYSMYSVFSTGKLFEYDTEFRLTIKKEGLVSKLPFSYIADAKESYFNEEEEIATKLIIQGFSSELQGALLIAYAPKGFTLNGMWENPVDNVGSLDKILLQDHLEYTVPSGSRVPIDINLGSTNKLVSTEILRNTIEHYERIDGFVTKEVIANEKMSPFQRGKYTYSLHYVHHEHNGVFLSRQISVDLEAYPRSKSYQNNNAIQSLIFPLKQDSHQKKMAARAVYVRFDTRFISEAIPSYYDKFIELPTAFTCDLAPEESVLAEASDKIDFFKEETFEISGEALIGLQGKNRYYIDNIDASSKIFKLSFRNTEISFHDQSNVGTYDILNAYPLYAKGLLFKQPYKHLNNVKQNGFIKESDNVVGK